MEQCQKCDGCSSHFSSLRPGIQDYSMSKHFPRDIDNYQQIMEKIMSCDKQGAEELHKFEEKIGDATIFRAKINGIHIVYAVSGNKLIFLRAFKNFKRYEKFLEDKKAVKNLAKV